RLLERLREQRHGLKRLDRLADAGGYLRGGDAGGEQLAGAPVAAFAGQSRRNEVADPRETDHRLRTRAQLLRVAPHLGENVPGSGPGGVQPLRLRGPGGEGRGVLGGARQLDAERIV